MYLSVLFLSMQDMLSGYKASQRILTFSFCFVFTTQDATQKSQKAFVHVASEIGAYEAEEIGTHTFVWMK